MNNATFNSTLKLHETLWSSTEPIIQLSERPTLVEGIPDGILALIAPVVAYWSVSLFFHILDVFKLAENYRIHPSEEVLKRNKAGRLEVLREVVLQHIIQTVVGYIAYIFDGPEVTGYELNSMWHLKQWLYRIMGPQLVNTYIPDNYIYYFYTYGYSCIKVFAAFAFIDTWQFTLHYAMHRYSALYKRFHSRHHQLYVPYAYGALFNHPFEGFLLDTCGTGIAMLLTRLTQREQIVLFTLATLKTVDDHCGFLLPIDPFQLIFPNNAIYHDIHHQEWGLKFNYAQPFFTFWDNLFGTRFPAMETELKSKNGKSVSIKQYKAFLQNRGKERAEKLAKLKETLAKDN